MAFPFAKQAERFFAQPRSARLNGVRFACPALDLAQMRRSARSRKASPRLREPLFRCLELERFRHVPKTRTGLFQDSRNIALRQHVGPFPGARMMDRLRELELLPQANRFVADAEIRLIEQIAKFDKQRHDGADQVAFADRTLRRSEILLER